MFHFIVMELCIQVCHARLRTGEAAKACSLRRLGSAATAHVLDISQCKTPCEHIICCRHATQQPPRARGMHAQACAAAPAMLAAAPASRARRRAHASRWRHATAPRARSRSGPAMATAWCGLAALGVVVVPGPDFKPSNLLRSYRPDDVPLQASQSHNHK